MTALYNEIDPYAAAWLRNLIADGLIAPGIVDTRSIVELQPSDVAGFTQVHFFAGIGGWSLAARLAGWPDDRPLWTGSCPCQPFSVAGKGAGQEDVRHLWPEFHRLIAACRPDVVMGEQVAAAVGKSWLDGVCSDLESIGYACGAAVVPACAVDAPHRQDRLWFVADSSHNGRDERSGTPLSESRSPAQQPLARWSGADSDALVSAERILAHAHEQGLEGRTSLRERRDERSIGPHGMADAARSHDGRRASEQAQRQELEFGNSGVQGAVEYNPGERRSEGRTQSIVRSGRDATTRAGFWHSSELAIGADGKARRVKPGIRLLAHGIPARVGKLRAFGNAIVPQVAAEIIGAYLDCAPD